MKNLVLFILISCPVISAIAQGTIIYIDLKIDGRIIQLKQGEIQLYQIESDSCLKKFSYFSSGDSLYFRRINKESFLNSINLGLEFGRFFIVFDSINILNNEINFMQVNIDTKPFKKEDFSRRINWNSIKTIYSMTIGINKITFLNRPIYKNKHKKYFY